MPSKQGCMAGSTASGRRQAVLARPPQAAPRERAFARDPAANVSGARLEVLTVAEAACRACGPSAVRAVSAEVRWAIWLLRCAVKSVESRNYCGTSWEVRLDTGLGLPCKHAALRHAALRCNRSLSRNDAAVRMRGGWVVGFADCLLVAGVKAAYCLSIIPAVQRVAAAAPSAERPGAHVCAHHIRTHTPLLAWSVPQQHGRQATQ